MGTINEVQQTTPDHLQEKPSPAAHRVVMRSRLAAIIGALAVGILYAFLPQYLRLGPNWSLLAIEVVLYLPLVLSRFTHRILPHLTIRILTLTGLGIVTGALAAGVTLLVLTLKGEHAATLLSSAVLLWLFNMLVFALWYWEIDGGGPLKRHQAGHQAADFMFPQQVNGNDGSWAPHFIDYLFLAFTGATAFSPTDTPPLTRRAKALMMMEALISLAIIVFLAARAVNIL